MAARLQDMITCSQHSDETVDAFASRLRTKSKKLTEWDDSHSTKELKDKTITAIFTRGLKPSIRKLVIPQNPVSFNDAITMARGYELNSELPSEEVTSIKPVQATSLVDDLNRRIDQL